MIVRLAKKANGFLTLREILDLATGYRLEDVVVGIETTQGVQDNTIGAVYLTVTATNEPGGLKCRN